MVEMKFMKLIIVFFIFALITPISFALESNMNESTALKNDSAPVENQTLSRFYIDRSNFETNIIYRMPAPQKYTNELPPIGVKEITYDSGNLRLKAWLSDKPADGNKHPAVVYAHGGFSFAKSEWMSMQEFIDQGFVLMAPTLRAENGNPGNFEYLYVFSSQLSL
jgi:dipeptidyl aminopeptidase/acylaminoacyl peptidase